MAPNLGTNRPYPLRLPATMRRELSSIAKREGISINQFIALALAEKIARLEQSFGLGKEDQNPQMPRTAAE